jgi:signal transduction histidine kinase
VRSSFPVGARRLTDFNLFAVAMTKIVEADTTASAPAGRLLEHPFFQGLNRQSAEALSETAVLQRFDTDDVVFEEGSAPEAMFLVLEGRVGFVKVVPNNRSRVVSYANAGDFFGEIGVFTGAPRALGAVAACPTLLARLAREDLRELIRRTPGPVDQILQSIVNHLHHTTRHYVDDMLKQEKMALVGNMVNTIIHDFKNPFTLISLGAELMQQHHRDERTRHLCASMIKQVERMVEMANEISEFSKGTQVLKPARVEMPRVLERFRELNEPFFQKDDIRIEMDSEPVVIEAEENKLLRVLQNLVGNAIDAVEEAGDGQVRIRVRDRGEYCEIQVSDNGKGIPEEIRNTIFEPFVTYGKKRGTGLGTAIVKSIVEAHRGRIRFETASGCGTTFFIILPKSQGARA